MNGNKIQTQILLKKIREEVAARKGITSLSQGEAWLIKRVKIKALANLIVSIHNSVKYRPFYQKLYHRLRYLKIRKFGQNEPISVGQLLQYHDMAFIENAYRLILQRAPDECGSNWWLSRLRNGQSSKIDILSGLRYCEEGVSKGVKIKGLFWHCLLNRLYNWPLIGYLIGCIRAAIDLPVLFKRLDAIDAAIRGINSQLPDKAEKSDFRLTQTKIDELNYQTQTKIDELNCQTQTKIDELNCQTQTKIDELNYQTQTKIDELNYQIYNNKVSIVEQQRKLKVLLDGILEPLGSNVLTDKLTLEKTHIYDDLYIRFEDVYRGSETLIRCKLSVYLPYIEGLKHDKNSISLLDIGCGSGFWLSLLKERGYNAKGIDINKVAVQKCLELGLDVSEADALEYLKACPPEGFTVITGFHILEHLSFEKIVGVFDEAYRVLKPDGLIIFETPNPTNILVSAYDFYRDPSHIRPLHPDTLNFIAQDRGFVDTASYFISDDNGDLKMIKSTDWKLETIEDYLKVARDFALIGYKPCL